MSSSEISKSDTLDHQYQNIFDHLPVGVFVIQDGMVIDANQSACSLLGFDHPDELKVTNVNRHLPYDTLDRCLALFNRPQKSENRLNKKQLHCQFVRKNGTKFHALARFNFIHKETERATLLLTFEHDPDHMVSQAEYRAIIDSAPVAIALFRHGRTVAVNRGYEELFRCEPGEGLNRTVAQDVGSEAASQQLHDRFNILLRLGEVVRFEHTFHRTDGSVFDGLCVGRLINPGAQDGFAMVWVIEDITDRHEREKLLEQARCDAEAASRAKTDFLASMSHEIRTPLNGVIGLAEMARDETVDELRRQHYLELMAESAQSLLTLISDVLDLTKIEAGKIEIENVHFDLCHLLRSIKMSFLPMAEAKGLMLELILDPEVPGHVRGDPLRLRQILNNFLSNAIKFTIKGTIKIRTVRMNGDHLRFEIIDTGLGLTNEAQSRLFKPFEQAEPETSRRFGGTGLGLSICRELSHRMNGDVGVNSKDGFGSTFWLEIPLPSAEGSHTQKTTSNAPDLSDMLILLVDDNPINLVVGRGLLERAKATVIQAKDGLQALNLIDSYIAQNKCIDAVLMDVQMPIMDGLQATRELRQRPLAQHIPVIATTAAVLQEDVQIALEAGMDGYVSKPFNVKALIQTVYQLVMKSRSYRK